MAGCARVAAALLILALLSGCVSLTPLEVATHGVSEQEFLRVGEHRVHVRSMGAGPPVLLVHGFGGSTYSWRHVQPKLATHYNVASVDLFGFGLTERPPDKEAYSRAGQVELLAGVIDALGWESAHVVGHSYGGGLAMNLAAHFPDKVRSLVLVDATAPDWADNRRHVGGLPPVSWVFVRALGLRPRTVRRSLERSFFDDALATDELIASYLERLKIRGAARAYRSMTTPLARKPDPPPATYDQVRQPVLVVWGENDTLIPVDAARQATDQLPDAKFEVIQECGHFPMEEKPERLLALISDFYRELR